jgi:hypothetical protein
MLYNKMGVCLYLCSKCGRVSHEDDLKEEYDEKDIEEEEGWLVCKDECRRGFTSIEVERVKKCWLDNDLYEDVSRLAEYIWRTYVKTLQFVLDASAKDNTNTKKFEDSLKMVKAFRRRKGSHEEAIVYVKKFEK